MSEGYFQGEVTQRAIVFSPDGDVLMVTEGLRPWTFPGGRIEADAEPEPALRRKLFDEIGVQTDVLGPVKTVTDVWGNEDGDSVFAVMYFCRARTENVRLDEDYDDHAWFSPEDTLERVHFEPLETAVERAVERQDRLDAVEADAE
jgi:8-oxo-dGTP diphosphatase